MRRCYKRYVETGSIARRQGSGKPILRTGALFQTIEDIMQADDETTAVQIRSYLLQRGQRLLSLSTILRARRELGWRYRGSAYTANLFARQTKRNALNGLVLTFMTILRVFCGQMNHLYNYSATKDFAAEIRTSSPAQSPVPSIPSRYMYGLESDGMELPKSAFLMA